METNLSKVPIDRKSFVSVNQNLITMLYKSGELCGQDGIIICEIANNLCFESCKIRTSFRKIGKNLNIANMSRYTTKFLKMGIIKKFKKDYYLNYNVASHSSVINKYEKELFKDIEEEYANKEQIDYSRGF